MTWLVKIEMESKEDLDKFVEVLPLSFPGLVDVEYEELED